MLVRDILSVMQYMPTEKNVVIYLIVSLISCLHWFMGNAHYKRINDLKTFAEL